MKPRFLPPPARFSPFFKPSSSCDAFDYWLRMLKVLSSSSSKQVTAPRRSRAPSQVEVPGPSAEGRAALNDLINQLPRIVKRLNSEQCARPIRTKRAIEPCSRAHIA